MENFEFDDSEEGLVGKRIPHRENKRRKYYIAGGFVLFVIFITLLIALIVQVSTCKSEVVFENNSGGSQKILAELSAAIFAAMNKSVDPCQDFYSFACGGWLSKTTIPSDKVVVTKSFDAITEENKYILKQILESDWPLIGPYYQSCLDLNTLNQKGSQPLSPWLNSIQSINNTSDLMIILALFANYSIPGPFGLFVDADPGNPSMNILHLWQGGFGLPNKDYYFNMDTSTVNLRLQYQNHISALFNLAGFNRPSIGAQILQFETQLASNSLSPTEQRDPSILFL